MIIIIRTKCIISNIITGYNIMKIIKKMLNRKIRRMHGHNKVIINAHQVKVCTHGHIAEYFLKTCFEVAV